MSWKEKLKTLTSKWHPVREELSTIATTGDYSDLINAPQSSGEGNDNIIEVVISYGDILSAAPSDYLNAAQEGNAGEFSISILSCSNAIMLPITYKFLEENISQETEVIYYFNNISQSTGATMFTMFAEYNNHYHAFQIDSFEISSDQKRYYIGSLKPDPEAEK